MWVVGPAVSSSARCGGSRRSGRPRPTTPTSPRIPWTADLPIGSPKWASQRGFRCKPISSTTSCCHTFISSHRWFTASTAISLILGIFVRFWSVIGALQIINLWLGLYAAPGEWPWTYFFLIVLQVVFALDQYGRHLGVDGLIVAHHERASMRQGGSANNPQQSWLHLALPNVGEAIARVAFISLDAIFVSWLGSDALAGLAVMFPLVDGL